MAISVLTVGIAVWAFVLFTHRQSERVRAVNAEAALAVESERGRFARDLHDILDHSLTVITMKAELAGRLLAVDPAKARREIEDLERLSRRARGRATCRRVATATSRCPVSWPSASGKTSARTRADAVRIAVDNGWL